MQVGIVKLHARLTATHALNGLAASVWDRASKARIGITLAGQKAAGVVVMSHERSLALTTYVTPTYQARDTLGCGCHHFDVPFRLGTPRSPAGCSGCYRDRCGARLQTVARALSAWAFPASHLRPSPKANANGAWGCGIDKPKLLDRFSTP